MEVVSRSKHSWQSFMFKISRLLDWLLADLLVMLSFLSVLPLCVSVVIEVGVNLSFVLLDRTKAMMSSLVFTPDLSKLALTISIFSFMIAFNLLLFSTTSSCNISFLSTSSDILTQISFIFQFNFLLNSRNLSNCVVISFPDNIFAHASSSSAIFLTQFARQFCTFSMIRFMGMQLYFRTRFCFHFAQSILLSRLFTYFRRWPAFSSPSWRSVQKANFELLGRFGAGVSLFESSSIVYIIYQLFYCGFKKLAKACEYQQIREWFSEF